jgi:hypothetical protein
MGEPRGQLAERTPVVHLKIARKIPGGMTSLYNVSYDTTMKSIAGGPVTTTVSGQATTKELPSTRWLTGIIHSEYRYPVHLKTRNRGAPEP